MPKLDELFARHRLRCTSQRECIYRALASTNTHPSADELYVLVKRKQPGIALATVYNALEAFTRRGLARRFTDPSGHSSVARYDADTHDHVHFVDQDGRVRDVPGDLGTQVQQALPREVVDELERRMGVQLDRVNIELIGRATGSGGAC